ncbi:MAG: hypothetical protein MJY89_05535 [Bacteroidales bacterium]|nr:hypothetical protein [Bacteroidales bacterium]
MKKNLLTVLAVAAALLLSGCRNCHQPHFKIVELRSAGKELPNPNIDPSHCKPEGAEATLRSIRYVPDKPIYYMDYTAKVDWESILTDETHQTQLFDFLGTTKKVNEALFDETYQIGQVEYPGAACSGFICYNSKGEMLNCRNYDGDEGEMVVVFNHNVKPGEHKSVMMTDLNAAQMTSGTLDYGGYEVLLRDGIDINVLLRQPVFLIDGMNDAGLVLTCYQLPDFQDEEGSIVDPYESPTPRPRAINQNTGKPQASFTALHYLILTTCETVEDAIELFRSYDCVSLFRNLNIHWCISDANNNWKTLEYWKEKDGTDSLYVFDEEARSKSAFLGNHNIAYEYMSMENYYYNPVPSSTFYMDYWQREFGGVFRAHNMMHHYSLIMDEEEALQCLQYGNFGIEVPGQVTNWSCVYNSKQKTILFNVRDELDKAFTIDLKKDL